VGLAYILLACFSSLVLFGAAGYFKNNFKIFYKYFTFAKREL
jgi:hypothetical protein